ncbi:hypothetical protein [Iodobacter fluviatilis]|uniref:DUF4926 domain-containing protein n=1 Tax=Iodobacter fluviatilis TaxID=537 RepID=A0A377QAM1_9NEIS|nr:hypothetical protein [Iodobacter fluviatilis]TCU83734.1 hypothetical protein EV682_11197 [Iodobacter fluviatilis]STQ91758.1 Uncharacterised protein [Iodobacter fluviatilis]
MHEPKDSLGKAVSVGARVRLLLAAPELINGLPESDQTAIQSVVGNVMVVEEFDQYGHAELMFNDEQGQIHFIWVKPSDLEVLS